MKETPSPSETSKEKKGKKRKGTVHMHVKTTIANTLLYLAAVSTLKLWANFDVGGSKTTLKLLKLKMKLSNDSRWLVFAGPETKKQVKKARKSGGLSGTSSDESNSDDSDKEVESDDSFNSVSSGEEDEDDFNPFKDDSSEDEEDGENL